MNFIKFVVPLVVVLGGAIWGMNKYNDTKHHDEYLLERADLRAQFLERAAAVRDTGDPGQYRDETRDLFKWWFTQLTELYNHYPEYKPADDAYLKDLDARKAAGGKGAEKYDEFKASYDQVKDVYDLIKTGKYSPAMTAADGSLRIDFLEFVPATDDKQKGIKGRIVVWGTPRHYLEERLPTGDLIHRTDAQLQLGDVNLKLSGDDTKPVGEASFGMPAGPFVPVPEQKIEDFPPLGYVGTFFFPLLPYKATKAEITASATVRTGKGNDVTGNFKWDHEIPADWRLKEGEEWKGADVQESDELDPANTKAPKKKK